MNPVRGYAMINFLHWVQRYHPEIRQLRGLPEGELMRLVNEYEGGKLSGNDVLEMKWRAGFHELFEGRSDWEGYASARNELNDLEHKRR